MVFVESLRLSRFRGIRESEDIRFSKFTVLIGRNNSGKTSILEALSLLSNTEYYYYTSANIPAIGKSPRQLVVSLHGGLSFTYNYTGYTTIKYNIKGREVGFTLDAEGKRRMLYPSSEEEFRKFLMSVFGVGSVDELVYQVLFVPDDSGFLRDLQKGIISKSVWFRVVDSNAHKTAIDVISGTVYDKFTEILVQFDELSVRKELPGRGPIYPRVYDLGDGVERVLAVVLWLETFKPKIVLWDDIEVAAHPGLIESVLRWLSSRDWQVIISTHSFDVLDRLVAIRPKDASVIVLSKDSSDRLTCKVLELDEVEEYFSKGIDIRKTLELL